MNRISENDFALAIYVMHDATAALTCKERVSERFGREPVSVGWRGAGFPALRPSYRVTVLRLEVDGEVTGVLAEGPIEIASDMRSPAVGSRRFR